MYFHTVSGDGWFIPFKHDVVDLRLVSEVLARAPAIEQGMALARCEIRPLTAGSFHVSVLEVLEYHPNVFEPERCSVSQFLTP